MPVDITIRVPDERWAGAFWDWYYEYGGEQSFSEVIQDRDIVGFENETFSDPCRETWTIEHRVEESE